MNTLTRITNRFFRGWLLPRFFDEPGHWRRWRTDAITLEQEGFVLLVFKVPEKDQHHAAAAVETLLQDRYPEKTDYLPINKKQ